MFIHVITSIVVLVGLILLATGLRKQPWLSSEHGGLFSKLVTQVTLPALIFTSIAGPDVVWKLAWMALIMLGAEFACLFLGWIAAVILKFKAPQKAAVILTAGFGSSSLLGYALISQIFPDNAIAISESVIISEIGVGPLLFTVGTMIAMYYGGKGEVKGAAFKSALVFFRSPIFISLVSGLIWSTLNLPTEGAVIGVLFSALGILADANTIAVVFTVGLVLQFQDLKKVLAPAAAVCLIKLVLKPTMVWLPASYVGYSSVEMAVLVLEASMPSALLTVVLCKSYGCDAGLASRLALGTSLVSVVSILIMYNLLIG